MYTKIRLYLLMSIQKDFNCAWIGVLFLHSAAFYLHRELSVMMWLLWGQSIYYA